MQVSVMAWSVFQHDDAGARDTFCYYCGLFCYKTGALEGVKYFAAESVKLFLDDVVSMFYSLSIDRNS